MKDELFVCNCETDAITVRRLGCGGMGRYYLFAFWGLSGKGWERTRRSRLRHIWNIIRHGTPWTDQVTLDYRTTKALRDKLTELLGKE